MTIYFSSDHHFSHHKISEYANRPFKTTKEMDDTMLQRWNSVVKPSDEVYYLGDLTLGNHNTATSFLEKMNGRIYLMEGNHDRNWYHRDFGDGRLRTIPPLYELNVNKQLFVLCHYSLRSWNKSHYRAYHLFGHHHGALESYGLSFDIGVDTHSFYPYSIDEVIEKMKTLTPIVDFTQKFDS